MHTKHLLILVGTRPEAIKLCPVYLAAKEAGFEVTLCSTGQHGDLLDPIFGTFNIKPDVDLKIMSANQTLDQISGQILSSFGEVLDRYKPDMTIVQGDTTSAMTAALSSFNHKVPVSHVEAGLRTGDINQPWPEEMNRMLIGRLATIHFAPTETAANALAQENIDRLNIHVTGNTAIDALVFARKQLAQSKQLRQGFDARFDFLDPKKKLILTTNHRREHFGSELTNVGMALCHILKQRDDVEIVFPIHPNPNVQRSFESAFENQPESLLARLHRIEPVDYLPFVYLMERARFIISDSGGLQEEAPFLQKTVLVTRRKTERPEALEAGATVLVGTNPSRIVDEAISLCEGKAWRPILPDAQYVYGNGDASRTIVSIIKAFLYRKADH